MPVPGVRRHNRSLSRGEGNNIKACPGGWNKTEACPGGIYRGGGDIIQACPGMLLYIVPGGTFIIVVISRGVRLNNRIAQSTRLTHVLQLINAFNILRHKNHSIL